jgi:pimeloyl-ACP methyl ester carboxylesterase
VSARASARIAHDFVQANGITFQLAHIETDGPLVLFLHGFPECWYSWRYQMPVLANAGCRVWAPDMRGYNLSDKPRGVRNYHLLTLARDVRELIRAAGVEQATIVGHDWGAAVAWRVAMEYPEVVSRLVILNVPHPAKFWAGIFNPRQLLRSWYIFFFQIPWLPEFIMSHNARRFAAAIRQNTVNRRAVTDDDVQVYAQAIGHPGAMHSAINYYRALARWGFWLSIKPIHAPTLMLWGENDVALGKELTYGTEKYVDDFRIHYIPNCSHWVQQDSAEKVNELLLNFIKNTRV